jgi:hypothetical protein
MLSLFWREQKVLYLLHQKDADFLHRCKGLTKNNLRTWGFNLEDQQKPSILIATVLPLDALHFPVSKTLSTLIFLPKIGQDMAKQKKVVCYDAGLCTVGTLDRLI